MLVSARSGPWRAALWGAILYWLSLPGPGKPPILSWLGWVACVPWIYLIARRSLVESSPAHSGNPSGTVAVRKLPGKPALGFPFGQLSDTAASLTKPQEDAATKSCPAGATPALSQLRAMWSRPYFQLWFVWFGFWLVTLHWLRYPHPAVAIGWIALSAYLGLYLPLFVAVSRAGVHILGLPILLVAPTVWTALEYVRAHLFTGFTLASLCHSQFRNWLLLQVCEFTGQYGLSFAMVFVAAACAAGFEGMGKPSPMGGRFRAIHILLRQHPFLWAHLMLVALVAWGFWRAFAALEFRALAGLDVLIVQGSIDVVFPPPPGTGERMHAEHWELTQKALAAHGPVDLIVWPETVYGEFLVDGTPDAIPPEEWTGSVEDFRRRLAEACRASRDHLYTSALLLGAPLIVGVNRQEWSREGAKMYNSAVFVPVRRLSRGRPTATSGEGFPQSEQNSLGDKAVGAGSSNAGAGDVPPDEAGRIEVYDKLHLVMFGEYIPYARYLKGLFELRPLSTLHVNTEPGHEPKCFVLGLGHIVPNICFESTVPHLIRRQLLALRRQGYRPNILVNLTNDGWFRGASALDLHLACSVFRAVEFRKPHLIAANTGLSAFVNSSGHILKIGKRRERDWIIAHVIPDDRESGYLLWGDWLGGLCLAASAAFVVGGILRRHNWRTWLAAAVGKHLGRTKLARINFA